MRRATLAALLVALTLAGCADPAPVEAGEATLSDIPDWRPVNNLAPLVWRILAERDLVVSPTMEVMPFSVPPQTIRIVANFTLDAGAAYGLSAHAGECGWDRALVFLATAQTIGIDCGGLDEGAESLAIATTAGALHVRAVILALVCEPTRGQERCPEPLPVTR